MTTSANSKPHVARRAELLAQLFLEDMQPVTLLETTPDNCDFDFLLGLETPGHGVRHFAVEVKAVENLTRPEVTVSMPAKAISHWRGSNLPLVFLIVDAKQNRYYFASGNALTKISRNIGNGNRVRVVLPLDEAASAASMAKALLKS
jgi:hypothetical protein